MNFVLNLVFQLYLIIFGNKFTYKKQLLLSLITCVITLFLIPFATIFFSPGVGFGLTCGLILVQGFANSVLQSSLYGLAGFLPIKYIIGVSFGNGFAGFMMNVIRYIIILIFGVNNTSEESIVLGSIIFFSVGSVILLIGMFLLLVYNKYLINYRNFGRPK